MLHRSATAWPPLSRTTPFGRAVVPEVYRMYSGSVAATGTQSAGWAVAISVSQSRSRPATRPGTILGHEAVGTVTATGAGVRAVAEGDRVLLSCISACGRCRFCRAGQYGQCLGGSGWIFGHLIDGVQADYGRAPLAATSTYKVPERLTDEQDVYLADILAIVGAGPIGLAAILGAKLYSPAQVVAIDPVPARRQWATTFGATEAVAPVEAGDVVARLTDGLGADVAIEAVGIPETFQQCTTLIRPGGHVANVGVHGKPATLHLESLWIRDVTITTGLVDTFSTPTLLRSVTTGQLDPTRFTTHRYPLSAAMEAYDTFAHAGDTNALKVLMTSGH